MKRYVLWLFTRPIITSPAEIVLQPAVRAASVNLLVSTFDASKVLQTTPERFCS
jgi:hypothetical protein